MISVLVAVKCVADYTVKVPLNKDRTGMDLTGIKMVLNPFDEVALEEAVRLKEKGIVSEVIAASIGDLSVQSVLRTALSLGADRAIHVQTFSETQPLGVAHALKALVEREDPQLVLLGAQAVDDDFNQTGPMLAALLGWPQGTCISSLMIRENDIQVIREIDSGRETLEMPLPAVVTVDLHLNQPRYPSLSHIMAAKQKTMEVLIAEDLGLELTPHLQTLQVSPLPSRKPGVMVPDVDTLLDKLHNEAKVI